MTWELKFGDKLDWFLALEADGIPVKALKERPELYPDLETYFIAFKELDSSRMIGFGGVGPIPMSEKIAYWREFGSNNAEDREDFMFYTRILDQEFLRSPNDGNDNGSKHRDQQPGSQAGG